MNIRYEELVKVPHRGFSAEDKAALQSLKGVGPTVIKRLEELGYHKLSQLAEVEPSELANRISQRIGATCWRNSPQAKSALEAIVAVAREC